MDINYDQANARIVGWSGDTLVKLRSEINTLGIRHAANSRSPKAAEKSLVARTPKRSGLIERVSYIMPRHMIYVHKGVGRGTRISEIGNTNRKAKPWFNPVIEANIDGLADIVAEEMGSAIINNILIR
jgi:hypothetical protein